MYRRLTFSIAILLLLTVTASALDIGQTQQFAINSNNNGVVSGTGASSVASFNIAPVNINQTFSEDGGATTYMQLSSSSLSQAAVSVGLYGDYGFEQNAVAIGSQTQTSSGIFSLGTQTQSLGAVFAQNTINNGSYGSTVAAQNFIGSGGQVITTPYGVNVNFVAVGVDSTSGVLVNRSLTINRSGL
jgi:hypothetical protein